MWAATPTGMVQPGGVAEPPPGRLSLVLAKESPPDPGVVTISVSFASGQARKLSHSDAPPYRRSSTLARRIGCNQLTPLTDNPRKRTGAKRRRAKKTAPQSRKVHGMPTYLCRTAWIKLIPGKLTHQKRFSLWSLRDFFLSPQKEIPQEKTFKLGYKLRKEPHCA